MRATRSLRRHFTLIELLVVIAIISVLAAMLLPVLAQGREQGRRAVCKSNLKQLLTAAQIYADDFDGYAPNYNGAGGYGTVGALDISWTSWQTAAVIKGQVLGSGLVKWSPSYLGVNWNQDWAKVASGVQIVVPDVLCCPSMPRTEKRYTSDGSTLAGVGGQAWPLPGAVGGYAILLGTLQTRTCTVPAGGTCVAYANLRYLPINRLLYPSDEVLMMDRLTMGASFQSTASANFAARWNIPHGAALHPAGTTQGQADGSVSWITYRKLNYYYQPGSYSFDRKQTTPYYASPTAMLNRGGYDRGNGNARSDYIGYRTFYGISTYNWGGESSGGTFKP